jgi:hypothetical protein
LSIQYGAMDSPIACTLGTRDYAAHVDALSALAAEALRSREPTPRGERLVFALDAERRLRDVIAAEAACCPFLRLDLRRRRDALVLEIGGPEAARPVIAALFRGDPGP